MVIGNIISFDGLGDPSHMGRGKRKDGAHSEAMSSRSVDETCASNISKAVCNTNRGFEETYLGICRTQRVHPMKSANLISR